MKITKIKHPKMVASDALQTRLRDEEDDLMESAKPNNGPQQQPRKVMDEVGPDRQGPTVPALKMKMMAEGGKVTRPTADDMEVRPDKGFGKIIRVGLAEGGSVMEPEDDTIEKRERNDERDLQSSASPSSDMGASNARSRNEADPNRQGPTVPDLSMKMMANGGSVEDERALDYHTSIAAAIMAKKHRQSQLDSDSDEDTAVKMAEGGEIKSHDSIYSDSSSQVDLSRNADEDANEEDQTSFNALRKENYSESEGLKQMGSPTDSNEHGRMLSDEDENDMTSQIRRRMLSRRQFKAE